MISGTDFLIAPDPTIVGRVCARLPVTVATPSEIEEIQAECARDRAMCLVCPDGMVVVELRARETNLELFVWIAIAFRYGAFERQQPALLKIASELKAETLALQSRRRGWTRKLGPEWKPRGTNEFVRRVR